MKNVSPSLQQQVSEQLNRFLPAGTSDALAGHVVRNGVLLKIKKPRKTKYGDYRPHTNGVNHIITINGDMNPFAFMVTLVHELAHMYQYKTYGRRVKPHGEEWKSYFKQLMQPYLHSGVFPENILVALKKYMVDPKATSCVDQELQEALRTFDEKKEDTVTVADLAPSQHFVWGQGRTFRVEGKMRKRYKCIELSTGRAFAFSALAEVKPL